MRSTSSKLNSLLNRWMCWELSDLFRPIGLHSSFAPVWAYVEVPIRDRNVHGEAKDIRVRNSKSKGDAKKYHLSSHEWDQHREEAPRHREEVPRDLYLSEKDYRTYGLRSERRNLDLVSRHSLETYRRDHDRDYQLRHLKPRAIFASRLERNTYDLIYTRQCGLPSIDPYLFPLRRDEGTPPTYARSYVVDTEPMRHATGALLHYT
ncbi:unnamed protein product [Citrullus colocynthis]|uniref:Uncharacterized protein n=1 Tax=Citrullus colocynthis TaxID=252529 RepID=A0ABP0XNW8_9ROSI